MGIVAGSLVVYTVGPLGLRVIPQSTIAPAYDPQDAIAFLPLFQFGFYLALWVAAFTAVGWTRFVVGLAALGLTQTASILLLHALANAGMSVHVRDIRAWAVAGPLLIFTAVVNSARTRR